jgi:hypothetical protein
MRRSRSASSRTTRRSASTTCRRSSFEKFDTLDEARAELNTLTHYGTMDIKLKKV